MFDGKWILAAVLIGSGAQVCVEPAAAADSTLDGRVVQMSMPFDDVTLRLLETRGGLTLELQASQVAIVGPKLYVGDGQAAVELQVDFRKGCVVKNGPVLSHGFVFKKGSKFPLPPGAVRAVDLQPGDVYVTLPGVQFQAPTP